MAGAWLLFFGLWLAPLGYLVVKAGYFPKAIGVLLIAACVGYLADFFTAFLAPSLASGVFQFVTTPAAAAGELSLMLWLLIKGVRIPAPDALSPADPTEIAADYA